MAKMISLKLSPKESKAESPEIAEREGPKYPYGTALYLNEDALAKLGIDGMPEVGDEFHIIATAKVTGTSEREYEGGSHKTLDLQLTEMACAEADDGDKELEDPAARKLYPDSGK